MAIIKKNAAITEQCVACGCCVKVCPLNIIKIHKGLKAVLNEEKCVGCAKCANVCPAAVISIIQKKIESEETEVADNELKEEALV